MATDDNNASSAPHGTSDNSGSLGSVTNPEIEHLDGQKGQQENGNETVAVHCYGKCQCPCSGSKLRRDEVFLYKFGKQVALVALWIGMVCS